MTPGPLLLDTWKKEAWHGILPFQPNCVFQCFVGSIAHGMYIDPSDPMGTDDVDTMAIVIPDIEHYFAFREFGSSQTLVLPNGKYDTVLYEFKKYIWLLMKGNPNVLMTLWLDDIDFIHRGPLANRLFDMRDAFVGKHVYHSFVGYARNQFDKMFAGAYHGYMGDKRKNLVERYGYDTKNAAHLIRLMRMCIEFLSSGQLHVKRNDAQSLIAIKRGEYTLEGIKSQANELFNDAENAYRRSMLPVTPDFARIEALVVELLQIQLCYKQMGV